ncbi:MAG TPA: energy transducer TonB [Kofleriaceae bacterium]|nr:energy transducer TonB [Kofleriaceae bacterium]
MFDNYVGAKLAKRSKWVSILIGLSIILHAGAGGALVIRSFWVIEKLDPPDTELALAAPPPPPPPPPAGSSKPKTEVKKSVKKVKETVQPDQNKKPEPEESAEDSSDEGVEGGVEGGVAGGVVGGVLGGVEGGVLGGVGEAPPPKVEEPKIVPQQAIEASRISGEKNIQPPNDVATQISRSGKDAVGVVKMCLSAGGSVSKLQVLKSTGYPSYDNRIKSKMREWKYKPFRVNGKAVPVCTSVTFIYRPAK